MEPGKCALEALAAVEAKPAISFTQRRHRCPWAKLTRRSRHCSESRSHIDCGNRKADRGAASNKKFMNLTQMASASVKIIFDTVSGWRQAGHPMREFEIMRSEPKDSTGRTEHPID